MFRHGPAPYNPRPTICPAIPLQFCTFVFNNFQDAPPATPLLSRFCIVAGGWGTPPSAKSAIIWAYKVPYILPSYVCPKSFVFTLFTKRPGWGVHHFPFSLGRRAKVAHFPFSLFYFPPVETLFLPHISTN